MSDILVRGSNSYSFYSDRFPRSDRTTAIHRYVNDTAMSSGRRECGLPHGFSRCLIDARLTSLLRTESIGRHEPFVFTPPPFVFFLLNDTGCSLINHCGYRTDEIAATAAVDRTGDPDESVGVDHEPAAASPQLSGGQLERRASSSTCT